MKHLIILLSILFSLFSFSPSLYEIITQDKLPPERSFVLEHNYMFDYNFYLSRIRQGQEGRWLVSEKYYNLSHQGSLIQIFYLYLGKVGNLIGLSPEFIYHLARLILGFVLLLGIGLYLTRFFSSWWVLVAFLFVVTSGSWPILVEIPAGFRFATYMGWWSAIDSLQRITFIPHVIAGQIFILVFIWKFGSFRSSTSLFNSLFLKERARVRFLGNGIYKLIILGLLGFVAGIIFPPALIVIYAVFAVLSFRELIDYKTYRSDKTNRIIGRIFFLLLSSPSLVYLSFMFRLYPWRALAEFDIQHRIILPYREYALALGPILPLGILGLLAVFITKAKKFFPVVSWTIAIGLLFVLFERVPWQSPSRFTEAAVHIPLGILATYFFFSFWQKSLITKIGLVRQIRLIRVLIGLVITTTVMMGILVMLSMVGWLTDQVKGKREGTWLVPIGAQLVYPLDDFMKAIYYLKDNTGKEEVVLGYVTAGNYIPAYAGNYVYLGHANTPGEDKKEKIASRFFSGEMKQNEAKEFLSRERISYIYFGPQERQLGKVADFKQIYQFVEPVYENKQVIIYRIELFDS